MAIGLVNWMVFGGLKSILYGQDRVGRHGKVFRILKFRTMRPASDDYRSWREGRDRERVTAFGRFLRRAHLDELPQVINILRGEMELIGPRPEMVEIDRWASIAVPGFSRRNVLLPGVTGLAQITQGYAGMDRAAYASKLAADTHYCDHVSLALDVRILLRTVPWVLRRRGWRLQASNASCPAGATWLAPVGVGASGTASSHPKLELSLESLVPQGRSSARFSQDMAESDPDDARRRADSHDPELDCLSKDAASTFPSATACRHSTRTRNGSAGAIDHAIGSP